MCPIWSSRIYAITFACMQVGTIVHSVLVFFICRFTATHISYTYIKYCMTFTHGVLTWTPSRRVYTPGKSTTMLCR